MGGGVGWVWEVGGRMGWNHTRIGSDWDRVQDEDDSEVKGEGERRLRGRTRSSSRVRAEMGDRTMCGRCWC